VDGVDGVDGVWWSFGRSVVEFGGVWWSLVEFGRSVGV